MSKRLHGFIIDPSTAVKNNQGDIVISYADIIFTGKPIVFLTPYSPSGEAQYIPTLIRVGDTHITIRDKNNTEGYRLNVVLADPNLNPETDKMYASSLNKTNKGLLEFYTNHPVKFDSGDTISSFLTPFWNEGSGYVGSVETVNYKYNDFTPNLNFISSNNAASNYFVNFMWVIGHNENRSQGNIPVTGSGSYTQSFINPWDHDPAIILTPLLMGHGAIAEAQEVVQKISPTEFSFTSKAKPAGSSVFYLAAHQDIPRFTKNSLDEAFTHIFEHFPNHKTHIDFFRQEFEDIILKGAEPSEALKNKEFDFIPSYPRTRKAPGEEAEAIAAVCFDAIALIINAVSAIKLNKTETAIKAIASALEEAGEETQSLIKQAASEVSGLYSEDSQLGIGKLKSVAQKLKNLAKVMFTAGLLKFALVAIYKHAQMPWYSWVASILTLVAQFAALIASAGAAFIAWIARMVAIIASAVTLGIDAYALYLLEKGKSG